MINLEQDRLVVSFPEVHPDAKLTVTFQRTLRLPDDGRSYPLPPGLGAFPLVHVDDHADKVPDAWVEHGGIIMPMYQAEAMWIHFQSNFVPNRGTAYPFAIKIYTGKINAVTGKTLKTGLQEGPQDYMVAPRQPWLDGYCIGKGMIRQFVAMPLGEGYTAEEQITGAADTGGLQLIVHPMKRSAFEKRFPEVRYESAGGWGGAPAQPMMASCLKREKTQEMGLAPGGKMRQEIFEDPYDIDDWDLRHRSRCFAHIVNSLGWRSITGSKPPHTPPTAQQYTAMGLPWFEYYDENAAPLKGSSILKNLKTPKDLKGSKNRVREADDDDVYDDDDCDEPVYPKRIVKLRRNLGQGEVREGSFWEDQV